MPARTLDRLRWTEDHGDGTKTDFLLLSDFKADEEHRFFLRLRLNLESAFPTP
jgi:hypothetical protein